jgi:hypothetical protein
MKWIIRGYAMVLLAYTGWRTYDFMVAQLPAGDMALTWLDFAGSLAAGVADMILRQSFYQGYVIPPALALFLLYGLPALVALNIAGVLYYFSNDGEIQIDQRKKELKFEITRQALQELDENKDAIAAAMKEDIFKKLRDDVTGKVARRFLHSAQKSQAELPVDSPNNGKVAINFNAETEKPSNPTRPSRQKRS